MRKELISMPLPIDNLFGESSSKAKEILILIGVVAALWGTWVIILLPFGISYLLPLILSIAFLLFWLSEILGQGKKKRAFFKRQLAGDLAEEHNIIGINMIEGQDIFYGGMVTNFFLGKFQFYTDGNQLTLDFERFLDSIAPFYYNLYFVNLPLDEDFSEDASKVKVYSNDKQVAQERYNYYLYQQEVVKSIKGYSVIIGVRATMDELNMLHDKVETLLLADATACFSHFEVAKDDMLSVILGADLGYEQDINVLLDNQYYDQATMSSLRVVDRG